MHDYDDYACNVMQCMQHKYLLLSKSQEDGGKKLCWGIRISVKEKGRLPLEMAREKKRKVIPRNGWNT